MRRREFVYFLGGAVITTRGIIQAQAAKKIPTVGVLWHAGNATEEGPYFAALVEGFGDLGYIDGRTIKFEHRFPNEIPERFRSFAAELVSLNVDVLVSIGGQTAPYLRDATATIPIVFALVPDPVESKLVHSLARPGGNVTGLSTYASDLILKRAQLLQKIVPQLSRVALLVNPNEATAKLYEDEARAASSKLGLTVELFTARSLDELDTAFNLMQQRGAQAVLYSPSGLLFKGRTKLSTLALAARLPSCSWSRETLEAGALLAYGPDYRAIVRRAPVYVDKILKGMRPTELPVEGPTKFQLLINLTTAKAIGISIPTDVLSIADELVD